MTGRHSVPPPAQEGALTRIWIDPQSGTWGAPSTIDFEVTQEELEFLENASDSEVINFAVRLVKEGR